MAVKSIKTNGPWAGTLLRNKDHDVDYIIGYGDRHRYTYYEDRAGRLKAYVVDVFGLDEDDQWLYKTVYINPVCLLMIHHLYVANPHSINPLYSIIAFEMVPLVILFGKCL